eukprot:scaffold106750_cov42-Phaeocystis_antarctica.AAC.1
MPRPAVRVARVARAGPVLRRGPGPWDAHGSPSPPTRAQRRRCCGVRWRRRRRAYTRTRTALVGVRVRNRGRPAPTPTLTLPLPLTLWQHEQGEQPQQQAALGEGGAGPTIAPCSRGGGEQAQPAERLRHLG